MMANRVAGKIKLQSVDQLLGSTGDLRYSGNRNCENPCVSESSI